MLAPLKDAKWLTQQLSTCKDSTLQKKSAPPFFGSLLKVKNTTKQAKKKKTFQNPLLAYLPCYNIGQNLALMSNAKPNMGKVSTEPGIGLEESNPNRDIVLPSLTAWQVTLGINGPRVKH